jgi:threonine/homoserine/homoserine lactone efflux protein
MMSLDFLLTSLIVVVSPGIGVVYTVATGLSRGPRASVIAAFACTLGIVPAHRGGGARPSRVVAHQRARVPTAQVRIAYLLYMAWQALSERGALRVEPQVGARSARQIVVTGILINILNPKLSLFFLAFLPQFVSAGEESPLARMLTLSAVFMLMTFAVFVLYGLAAAAVRDHVISRPQVMVWMRRAFAGAFAALGAKLAFTER